MILGNKCDMTERRQVGKERGEAVSGLSFEGVIGVDFRANRS